MPQHKSRPDSLFETADTTQDPRQNRRGTLRFPPQLEMRPSSIAPTPEESREAPHNSKGFLISQRQHERLPQVPFATRGNPHFLPQLEKHFEIPPSMRMRPDSPAVTPEQSRAPPRNSKGDLTSLRQHERLPEYPVLTGEV